MLGILQRLKRPTEENEEKSTEYFKEVGTSKRWQRIDKDGIYVARRTIPLLDGSCLKSKTVINRVAQ